MPSITITYPPTPPNPPPPTIQVQGGGGNFVLSYIQGFACTSADVAPTITARVCDHNNAASCKPAKPSNTPGRLGYNGTDYLWSFLVPNPFVKNVSKTGADNDAIAYMDGFGDSGAVQFLAANPQARDGHRPNRRKRPYRLRFLTNSLPPLLNFLADLGLDTSIRVKLKKVDALHWASDDGKWELVINGSSADISAQVDVLGAPIQQKWNCFNFNAGTGGDFLPLSLDLGGGVFDSPLLPVILRVT